MPLCYSRDKSREKMKSRLLYLLPLVLVFVSLASALVPLSTSAVAASSGGGGGGTSSSTPSDSQLIQLGIDTPDCQDAASKLPLTSRGPNQKKAYLNSCGQAYAAGYKDPTGDKSKYCGNTTKWPGQNQTLCLAGYPQGQSAGKAAASGNPASSSSTSSSNNADPSINCGALYNPLNWFICPLIKAGVEATKAIDNIIASQLSVGTPGKSDDPNQIFCDKNSQNNITVYQTDSNGNFVSDANGNKKTVDASSCTAYKEAWSSVRNLALGALVIAGLVVVIAQALGVEVLDAYTVRKVLPRLVIVAVGITLSWELMRFFVTLTNDLGYGIRAIIYYPFRNIQNPEVLAGGGQVVALLLGLGGLAFLGILGLLSFVATALLAVFVAFVVLVIRQLVIILLIILAPIAIVAYVLPNTQNIYKLWWDSFSKGLLMFPIIMGFIAVGRVAAVTAGAGDSSFGRMLAFASYFAPYFLLPLTFKFAGGALRQIGGFVNDRHKGGFDRLRNFRGERAKKNMALMQSNRRFNENRKRLGGINARANTALSALTSPGAAAKIYGGAALNKLGLKNSYGASIVESIDKTKADHSAKLAERLNRSLNDKALGTLIDLGNRGEVSAPAIREAAESMLKSDDATVRAGGTQLLNTAQFLGQDLYQDDEMGRANVAFAAGLAQAQQGFLDTQQGAEIANKLGSKGLGVEFLNQAARASAQGGRTDWKLGYSHLVDQDGNFMSNSVAKVDPTNFNADGSLKAGADTRVRRATLMQTNQLLSSGPEQFTNAKAGALTSLEAGIQNILSGNGTFIGENGQEVKITQDQKRRFSEQIGTALQSYQRTSPKTYDTLRAVVERSALSAEEKVTILEPQKSESEAARRASERDEEQKT